MNEQSKNYRGSIVALIGAKGSGKTTLARWAQEASPRVVRMAFADPIRDMLIAIGVPIEYLTIEKTTPIPNFPGNPTGRHLMQTLGTEWGRMLIDSEIWVDRGMQLFNTLTERGHDVYVDDCRFPNEAEAIRKAGGLIVRLRNDEAEKVVDEHTSEKHWREIEPDFEVSNNGTVKELAQNYLHEVTVFRALERPPHDG